MRSQGRRRFWPGALAAVAAASLLWGLVGPAVPAQAAEITDGLALWYRLDATSGTVAVDSWGNGRNGTVNGTDGWSGTGEGLTFDGAGTYIKVPDDIMSGMNSITVSMDVQIDAAQTTPYFIYGFGNTSNGSGNGYLFTTGNSFRTAIASGAPSTEQNTQASGALQRSVWKHVTYTQTGNTGVLYRDGVEVTRNTSVTITPGSIGSGSTTANYIGKSVFTGDNNRALAPGEVLDLSGNTTGIAKVANPALKTDAVIDDANSRITLPLAEGTDLTVLAPQFTLANGSSISPASGAPRDFTKPVTYEVTGSDGARRTWTVAALIMRSPVLPGFTADPDTIRFGDTYYMYPTTDGFPGWSGTRFKAYSSKDLVHWSDHGAILDLGPDISWADSRAWAPTIEEKNGKYYFMWSENDTRDENYRVAYATGSSPTGPWTKQGVILEKDLSLGIKGTGHHSVVQVPNTDDWYIAYHRFAIPSDDGTHRETTIDKLEFASDGLIKKVVSELLDA
ncbi:family 43 glycosylhydrolase [Streptomyces sp. ISL-44]|uniref:family 43 glycosylhydrolase n=1 Tax=Streptomyces sp. ISL-44 TaxID=2819184 RepID=UPI0035ABF259